MSEIKIIKRSELIKKMEETFPDKTKSPYLTLERCCNSIKKVRVIRTEKGLSMLALMGTNVYMLDYPELAKVLPSLFVYVDEKEKTFDDITELDADDKQIGNKKWYEYTKNKI